jgi:hypothetical protein
MTIYCVYLFDNRNGYFDGDTPEKKIRGLPKKLKQTGPGLMGRAFVSAYFE